MISAEWDRSRRRQSATALAVLTVAAALISVFAAVGVPEAWWPQIGSVFVAGAQPAVPAPSADACAPPAGPTRCAPSPAAPAAQPGTPHGPGTAGIVRFAVPVAVLVLVSGALSLSRRRS
ncbi:hypothetical protein ACFWXK_10355 [Streptomyces sp. NPDC059070]|uniref:hypothetical protein n=1 Tax=Streptomyces sp. NPDC059070 TaxID=3346713 RepID=UPI0036CDF191